MHVSGTTGSRDLISHGPPVAWHTQVYRILAVKVGRESKSGPFASVLIPPIMPKARATRRTACAHEALVLEPSKHAQEVGYTRPNAEQRQAATQPSGRIPQNGAPPSASPPSTFPPPLVLIDDELAYNPKYPPQSFRSWAQILTRIQPSARRGTVYVVPPPSVHVSVDFLADAVNPLISDKAKKAKSSKDPGGNPACKLEEREMQGLVDYLRAFYLPLPVKLLTEPALQFVLWQDDNPPSTTHAGEAPPIALSTDKNATRIRHRPSGDGVFTAQLNLNDVLDVALDILPADAHSIIMLTHHDLYEDEEDDFCCGRAYGGSRVSVVSTARYNPAIDHLADVDREHAWPASHCAKFVAEMSGASALKRKRVKPPNGDTTTASTTSAVESAVRAHAAIRAPSRSEDLSALWLSRLCKTASHELGHCFGMDHCVYYACVMQGTSCLAEDSRQPPYLCPVDLAKLLRATGGDERKRYQALLSFCEKWDGERLFAGFAAWLRARLDGLGSALEGGEAALAPYKSAAQI